MCTRCRVTRPIDDFMRTRGTKTGPWAVCNRCSAQKKQSLTNKGPTIENTTSYESPASDDDSNQLIESDRENEELIYELGDLEELVAVHFQEEEGEEHSHVQFSVTIELSDELVEMSLHEIDQNNISQNTFHRIVNTLVILIEAGSKYYWELNKLYINTKDDQSCGCASAYLFCSQRIERQHKHPCDQPVQRISEVRPAIERFPCNGKIKININIPLKRVKLTFNHLYHQQPTYRETRLPQVAINWIKTNLNHNLRKVEFHKRLSEEKLIDPTKHTYHQVYYWALKLSAGQYITNIKNQVISTKDYMQRPELIDAGYKLILHIENNFVRALGFTTPFMNNISKDNINELIIDSTFKTNQEKFELFALIINCGGFGMPLAYLYLDTFTASEDLLQNPINNINNRVMALAVFFQSMRAEQILPSFILLDKDMGQIAAVQEAWSWTTNIQLCLWHVERAIDRKINEKNHKSSQYSIQRAREANEQFTFIDPNWIPTGRRSPLCSEADAKAVMGLIKKHSILHPLIPVDINVFLTSDEIYHKSTSEIYQYCQQRNLVHLWAYLWINWYSKKNWKLFARSSYPRAMPIARTTMIVESHWRVLKHNYKYNYNRPRLDHLNHIITARLVPDMLNTWQLYRNNRSYPSWWKAFKTDWRKCLEKDTERLESYHVDVDKWICSCPAFINSPYLVCKHLIQTYAVSNPDTPQYKTITRRHDYPFIYFGEDDPPRIHSINTPWNHIQQSPSNEPETIPEVSGESESSESSESSIRARFNTIGSRKAVLATDKRIFESLNSILEQNIENDNLFDEYIRLRQNLIDETLACSEVLNARRQQSTWQPSRNRKLAFWLR
jgi:hypothetical protein